MDVKLAASIAAKSEHDIDPRNFIISPQIILKFYLHVYLECSFVSFKLFRPLLVGNLLQLHRPHQIWLPHECVIIVIIKSESQRISLNIHKITTVFVIHVLTLPIMHCFDVLT